MKKAVVQPWKYYRVDSERHKALSLGEITERILVPAQDTGNLLLGQRLSKLAGNRPLREARGWGLP